MRNRPALALLTGALVLSGCALHPADAQTAAIPVHLAVAEPSRFANPAELAGTVVSAQSVTLGAASAGRVVSVNVRVGDRVAAGEVIAQVDATAYGAQLAGARAGAAAAYDSERASRAQLAQARSRYHLASVTAARMSRLYAQGAISRQQQDETQADLDAAQAGVDQAQAGLAAAQGLRTQAQAGVTAAAVPLANATIVAPFAGAITQRFVAAGAVVGPGSPVAVLENTGDLELDVALPEDQAGTLAPGGRLTVRVDALGDTPIAGTVRALAPSDDPALRSVTLRIAIAAHPGLLPGMFARVAVPGIAREGTAVPLAALVTRAGQSGIFVVRNGTAIFIPLRSAVIHGNAVQIEGVTPGTRVADSALDQLTDGAAVSVTK
jgi:RND family efflux transporter MFP subunit